MFGSEVRVPFTPSARYPDPAIEMLDPAFARYRLYSAGVEQLTTGLRWAEGPLWFGDGRYLLVSDLPNDRILRWDECSGATSVFRHPAGFANGHARDAMGRLVSCEQGGRRVRRTEFDGSLAVLADRHEGRRLNSPNDIVCAADGSLWFTDPGFGIAGWWEGEPADQELPHAVYRLTPQGVLQPVISDLAAPNGLAFAPGGRALVVVESRAEPWRRLWRYDVDAQGCLSGKRLFAEADDGGAFDGIKFDIDGNLWCGYGSNGRPGVASVGLDGVRVLGPQGRPIGHVHLPERCANLCFGGRHRNRLFMAASHSVYALFVNTQGAAQ